MLYHREVYWPAQLEKLAPKGLIPLLYTNHARNAAQNDRYGIINRPEFLNSEKSLFFEAEVDGRNIKFAVRTYYDAKHDIVLVIMKEHSSWVVKTVWLNLKSDSHKTLRKNAYATA